VPFVDPSRLELVRVLDYGLDGIIDFNDIRSGSLN